VPVYKQTYTHYSGTYLPRAVAWMIIALSGIKHAWRKKGVKFFLFVSLFIFLNLTARIYIAANSELIQYLGINPHDLIRFLEIKESFYMNFLQIQQYLCFLLTVIIGSDLISADRRTKALILYLSKPISRLDYLFGKGAILLAYLYGITLFPAWLLMFLYAFFTDNWNYLFSNVALILRIFAYSNIIVLPLTTIILLFSSITHSKVVSASMYCAFFTLPFPMTQILKQVIQATSFNRLGNKDWWSFLSIQTNWDQIAAALFHQNPVFNLSWIWHLSVLTSGVLLAAWLLYRQIQPVEVIK
jgi:ABC-2 type transport system permease protein